MTGLQAYADKLVGIVGKLPVDAADNGLEVTVIKFFTECPEGTNDELKLAVHQAILRHYQ